ncbi:MAG: AEC family transporter [Gaiellales bacterium]
MVWDLLLLAVSLLIGLRLQRLAGGVQLRQRIWAINYVLLIPLAATYAFLSIDLGRSLLAIISVGVVAWWLTVLLAGLVARLLARTRHERGALWLVGGFPNTGFLGYPLAHLAFGTEGLRWAIIYDQVSLVIPMVVVSTLIARAHSMDEPNAADMARTGVQILRRELLRAVPLWTVLVLIVLRLTVLREPVELESLGAFVAAIVGPMGFLLLGLSLPLHGFVHDRRDVVHTICASLVRIVAAPALLWGIAHLVGVQVPGAIYLVAAMPTAFHTVVIARVFNVQPALVRLGVVISTVAMLAVTLTWLFVR